MDKETLEVVLGNFYNDSKIKRIIEMSTESAVAKGENYASDILKVTLKVVLGNGRMARKSYIAKKGKNEEGVPKVTNTEVSIYTNILKEMDYLMEEFEDKEGPLWCQFIHYSPSHSTIILEDLKAGGFNNVPRSESQDLDHARLVLRSLGRFHAMAKVLEARGLISKDDYKPYPFINDDGYVRNLLYGGKLALTHVMRKTWGEEWSEYADKLSQVGVEEFSKRIKECGNFDDNTFKCLNHGDCWNNNIMFKHDWAGKPKEMRFVDYQIPHYNSPCVDVIYYIYTSIKSDIRRQNYVNLVELYHESLISYLDKFGYSGTKPSLRDINDAMERLSYFALSFFIGCSPFLLSGRTDALDLDSTLKTKGKEGIDLRVYSDDGIVEKIGEEVKRIVKLLES